MLLKGDRTSIVRDMGGFVVRVNMPGWLKPRPTDHGHGPLAMIVESSLDPGRPIAMHEHRNDEIISWVPFGVMRHDDKTTGRLVTDSKHLLVMNAGRSFWHSEETLSSDPPLRMLQIFVRPRAVDLDPRIQHGPIPLRRPNTWRHLVGPEGGDAPSTSVIQSTCLTSGSSQVRGSYSRTCEVATSTSMSTVACCLRRARRLPRVRKVCCSPIGSYRLNRRPRARSSHS